jgi:hypothetical protein
VNILESARKLVDDVDVLPTCRPYITSNRENNEASAGNGKPFRAGATSRVQGKGTFWGAIVRTATITTHHV